MQTSFSPEQLADPDVAETERILRNCVHCGFCTATCPTYVLLGDELDSPRGRIYLVKDMLENDRPATPEVVKHIDRCLSCLSCMTTCPSGVHYMHLVDHARRHIEKTYDRPAGEKRLRDLLAWLLPRPWAFRMAVVAGWFARPAARFLPRALRPLVEQVPARIPSPGAADRPGVHPAEGERRMRVAVLPGCAQQVVAPEINAATIRLLTRHGCEVVYPRGFQCCGAIVHHMGREDPALDLARRAIEGWWRETREGGGEGLDAIVVNASGCGTTVKDYAFMLREDPAWAEKAKVVSALALDVSELMDRIGLVAPVIEAGRRVTYHAACSLQHGQQIKTQPKTLLAAAGFAVREPAEGHLCCGSAGTYNLLQPEIAGRLKDRKLVQIARTAPEIVASGNVGCIGQLRGGAGVPVVHTVELLDWATGGPKPAGID